MARAGCRAVSQLGKRGLSGLRRRSWSYWSLEFRNSAGASWPFLEDPERIVQKDLEIQQDIDRDNDLMIPHALVLKPGLVIYSIYNGY